MSVARRTFAAALAFGWIAAAQRPAAAAERAVFTDATFAAAQATGRKVVIEVTAPWCPTCRVQRPLIDATLAQPEFSDALLLSIDFDSMKAPQRQLNVRSQSTILVFRGAEERGRATGITDPAAIAALLRRAL